MKINIHEIVEQVFKEELAKVKEVRKFGVDKNYTHFALRKSDNKIVNGWDYKGLDKESILYYVKMDLKDMDIKPSDVSLLTVQGLKQKGIDPFSWDSWQNTKGVEEATTTIVTPDGKTLTQPQKDLMKTAKPGTTVVVKKAGEISEKVDKEEAEAPADKEAPATASAESVSDQLNNHISAAIDAAAKCIQDTGDKKYEKVLGKVVKNLTAAQAALEDVQARESQLAEQAAVEDEKTTAKYTQALRKALKGSFKNPDHIEQIVKKYNKVIKASKDKPAAKLAEMIAAHALKEGFIVK